jgi:hypothetical protein
LFLHATPKVEIEHRCSKFEISNNMIVKVFYYYYYRFYKNWDPDPTLAAKLGLTGLEIFFFDALFNIAFAQLFCFDFNKYYMFGVAVIVTILNLFYLFTSKKVRGIIESEPNLFDSHKLTIITVLVMSLLIISTLFWTFDYVDTILRRCRLNSQE